MEDLTIIKRSIPYWNEPPAILHFASSLYTILKDQNDNLLMNPANPELAIINTLPIKNWREITNFRVKLIKDLVSPGTTPTRLDEALKNLMISVLESRFSALQLCTGDDEHSNWKAWRVLAERINEQNRQPAGTLKYRKEVKAAPLVEV